MTEILFSLAASHALALDLSVVDEWISPTQFPNLEDIASYN